MIDPKTGGKEGGGGRRGGGGGGGGEGGALRMFPLKPQLEAGLGWDRMGGQTVWPGDA